MELGVNKQRTNLLIIPFYNEEKRFQTDKFHSLLAGEEFDILFINDGSIDSVPEQIRLQFISKYSNAKLIDLIRNLGKSEALRRGLIYAVERNYHRVGFTDFDLSTPPSEISRLMKMCENIEIGTTSIFGVRNIEFSSNIRTSYFRRRQGRLFQKIVNFVFGFGFQDLQCGMKIFPVSVLSTELLSEPFINQWLFELELLLRLPDACIDIAETNLNEWNHFKESKVRVSHFLFIVVSIVKLYLRYRKITSIRSLVYY